GRPQPHTIFHSLVRWLLKPRQCTAKPVPTGRFLRVPAPNRIAVAESSSSILLHDTRLFPRKLTAPPQQLYRSTPTANLGSTCRRLANAGRSFLLIKQVLLESEQRPLRNGRKVYLVPQHAPKHTST